MFAEAVLKSQGRSLEEFMTMIPTSNPAKMELAKQRLEEAICLAIQASKETVDGSSEA